MPGCHLKMKRVLSSAPTAAAALSAWRKLSTPVSLIVSRLSQSLSTNPRWLQAVSRSWSPQSMSAPIRASHARADTLGWKLNWCVPRRRATSPLRLPSASSAARTAGLHGSARKASGSAFSFFLSFFSAAEEQSWRENVGGHFRVEPAWLRSSPAFFPQREDVKVRRGANLSLLAARRSHWNSRSGCAGCTQTNKSPLLTRTRNTADSRAASRPRTPPFTASTQLLPHAGQKARMTRGAASARGGWGDPSHSEPPIGGRPSSRDRERLLTLRGEELTGHYVG